MSERFWQWLAWKLPHRLAWYTGIRVMANASVALPDKTPGEITVEDVMREWSRKKHSKDCGEKTSGNRNV